MLYFTMLAIVLIGLFLYGLFSGSKSLKKSKENEEKFKSVLLDKDLPPDQIIFTQHNDSLNCLSVNESKRKLSFGYTEKDKFMTKDFDFSDIVAFELLVDGHNTGKLSVGGAIVGGALAGGVGAIIGGTTGKEKQKVDTMHLLITLNSISNPLIKFSILNPSSDGKGYDKDNFMVRHASNIAEKWTGIFKIILSQKINA